MKKNLNKLATLALTGILMTGMSFGALADTNLTDGKNTTGGDTLILTKELGVVDVDSEYQASAPAIQYTYSFAESLTANELGTVSATDQTARKDGHAVGNPTVSAEAFVANEKANKNKVSKDITLNFENVHFTEAGVYRYKLVEGAYSAENNFDYTSSISVSTDKGRYIDVYVGWNEAGTGLEIKGYVVSKIGSQEEKTSGYEVTVNGDGTDVTYGDKYSTYDLIVTKHVAGTLGEKTKKFTFTSAVPVPNGAGYSYTNAAGTEGEKTEESQSEELQDSQSFTIKGVPVGHEVTVTEENYSNDGYKTYTAVGSENYGAEESREVTAGKDDGEGATAVNFKNEKNETTPTGVVMNIAPYAAMVLGAGAFAGVFLGRKKSEDEE